MNALAPPFEQYLKQARNSVYQKGDGNKSGEIGHLGFLKKIWKPESDFSFALLGFVVKQFRSTGLKNVQNAH